MEGLAWRGGKSVVRMWERRAKSWSRVARASGSESSFSSEGVEAEEEVVEEPFGLVVAMVMVGVKEEADLGESSMEEKSQAWVSMPRLRSMWVTSQGASSAGVVEGGNEARM
jgi:hypothetical protein